MELGDCTGLVGLQVLQVEAAHQVVITPDVFRDQMDLKLLQPKYTVKESDFFFKGAITLSLEPRCEKTGLRGFQPGPI